MTDETVKNLELLKRKMERDIPPVLFTGAGFSYGAKNGAGNELPLGQLQLVGALHAKDIAEADFEDDELE